MQKIYEAPVVGVVVLEAGDILTVSNLSNETPDEPNPFAL